MDITVNRHRGHAASADANPSSNAKRKSHARIFKILIGAGDRGLTSKEIGTILNKPLNTFSGRLSEMKARGMIVETGGRRGGASVLRISDLYRDKYSSWLERKFYGTSQAKETCG